MERGTGRQSVSGFHTIRLAVPRMKQNRWGRIINVSSIYGLRGAANRVGYVTSKTALIGLTRAVALETVAHGITCNAVCPGHERDAGARGGARRGRSRPRASRAWKPSAGSSPGKQPTGRFVAAEHVASLIVFLCGPEAADITGSALPIDGGWSALTRDEPIRPRRTRNSEAGQDPSRLRDSSLNVRSSRHRRAIVAAS